MHTFTVPDIVEKATENKFAYYFTY